MALKLIVRNVEEIQNYLKSIPRNTVKVSLEAITDWYIGQDDRGLRHYEPYKHIGAPGDTFRSYSKNKDKKASQLRWIFAHLDQIGHENRSDTTKNAWKWKTTNNGYGVTFTNDAPGATYLWSDKKQTLHNKAVGHRTVLSKMQSNLAAAMRHAQAAINRWLKS